jgi:putative nucleotidyltransferase with HDIG domain
MHKTAPRLPPRARAFIAIVVGVGVIVVGRSIYEIAQRQPLTDWLILAGLTILTGSFSIKLPSISARFSVSEAFVIAAVILFGPGVATVIVVLDSLVVTSWIRRGYRSSVRALFNMTAGACSLWLSAQLFEYLRPTEITGPPLEQLAVPVLALALSYFAINSALVAIAISYETGSSATDIWRQNFAWLSLNYLGGASVAILLVTYTRNIDLTALSVIVPLLVIIYLTFRTSLDRIDDAHRHLAQVNDLYLSTIETLAMAVDAKDQITHGHIRRVQVYAVELAKRLGVTEPQQIKAIEAAALLHDVGKLGIPEHILNKPGSLNEAEFSVIKRHADIGADLLSSIRFPYPVVPIVRHHHERWDGTGYPSGISKADIPVGARILSVVDCFDALNSDRPYRPKLTVNEAFEILRQRRGTMYDPWVVDTFISVYPQIADLADSAGKQAAGMVVSRQSTRAAWSQAKDTHSVSAIGQMALNNARQEIQTAKDVRHAFRTIDAHVRRLTRADGCALFRHSLADDTLVCSDATGGTFQSLVGHVISPGERVTGWVWANRRTINNANAAVELGHLVEGMTKGPLRALSTLVVTDAPAEPLGVLTVYALGTDEFDFTQVHIVEQLAGMLGDYIAGAARVA